MHEIRREFIARKTVGSRNDDISKYVFGFFIKEFSALELIAGLERLFEDESRNLTAKDKSWIETEITLREAAENPFRPEGSENGTAKAGG